MVRFVIIIFLSLDCTTDKGGIIYYTTKYTHFPTLHSNIGGGGEEGEEVEKGSTE